MKIVQIINNNVALVDRGGNQVVVYASGIAFSKKKGDQIDQSEIERVFVLDSNDKLEHFSYLLSHVGEECLQVVNEIIDHAERSLGVKTSDYIYLVLLDHVSFLRTRLEKGEPIKSPLAWEVKKYYPAYYQVGLDAIAIVSKRLGITCPDDEAVSFALHFINQQLPGIRSDELTLAMEIVKDVLNIISRHYQTEFDESSINYMRLVTHVQFFATRLVGGERSEGGIDSLHDQVCTIYPEAYACVRKIGTYVSSRFGHPLSSDEETYLILHVQRVTQRS